MTVYEKIETPRIIYTTKSKFNGDIQIVEIGKTRKVVVGDVTQSINFNSPSCKSLYWGKLQELSKKEQPDAKRIMILGLGGGTLAHLLSTSFPEAEITSIEIDPIMVDIAKKYFDLDKLKNHKVILEDALRVVVDLGEYEITPASFDLIVVDILAGEKYPDLGRSGNFLGSIKNMLKPDGIVVFNRLYKEVHQDEVNLFIEQVEDFFSDVDSEVVAGHSNSDNILIYARI